MIRVRAALYTVGTFPPHVVCSNRHTLAKHDVTGKFYGTCRRKNIWTVLFIAMFGTFEAIRLRLGLQVNSAILTSFIYELATGC